MKNNNKGFTLAELLIVVAIIAVLVSISIPMFTDQLEKSREAVDLSNIRSAYAEIMVAALTDDTGSEYYKSNHWEKTVDLKQKKDGWQTSTPISIGGVTSGSDGGSNSDSTWIGSPKAGGTCVVKYSRDGSCVFTFGSGDGSDASDTGSTDTGSSTGSTDTTGNTGSNTSVEPTSDTGNTGGSTQTGTSTSTNYSTTVIDDKDTFTGTLYKGTVYTIDGEDWVFLWDRDNGYTVDQYNKFPSLDNYQNFQKILPDAVTYTAADYKGYDSTGKNNNPSVRRGDLYKDSTGLYVRAYDDGNDWMLPEAQPRNWVLLK